MKKTAVLVLAAMAAVSTALADRSINETRPLAGDGRVEISNIAGEVKVEGWSGDGVVVTGTLEDGIEEVDISSGGSRLSIEVRVERRARNNGSAYLTIKVPATAEVDVETVSADISVDGVTGEVDLESVSGDVEVSGAVASLSASSVSGDVRVATATGRSELETVSGKVVVRDAAGRLEVGAVSGEIEIEGGSLDSLTAETVSGSIFCRAVPTGRGRFSLESMSGSIELSVPSDVSADFEIETYSGEIKNDIGPRPSRSSEYGPGRELIFTAGAGGARVSIESFSGTVKLRVN
jgi:DUF4097 and DUF4098 domain-containing protein YvlB